VEVSVISKHPEREERAAGGQIRQFASLVHVFGL
jgi:hypothetical protein